MKHFAKRSLSVFLAVLMLASICVIPASAAEVEGENGILVYIGDSMTFDFVGSHNGYLESTDIFAWQAARAMGYTTDDYGKLPGGRSTDAYAAISDYPGDDYSIKSMNSYVTGNRAARLEQAVTDAKAVVLQIGYSETTTFLLDNITYYIDKGELNFNCDLSQVFSQEELKKIMPFVSKSMKLIDSIIPDNTRTALADFFSQLSADEKEAVIAVIGQEAFDTLSGVKVTAQALKDVFLYTLVSALVHYDALIGRIYELNPDVELYVMGLISPISHLRVGFNVGGKDYSVSVGDLIGGYFTIFNNYYKVFSPYSDQYYFVENYHHVETYSEAMVNDQDLTARVLYAYYNNNPKPLNNNERRPRNGYNEDEAYARNEEAYAKAQAQAPGVMQMLQNTLNIDLGKVIAGLIDGAEFDTSDNAFAKLENYDENGNITASYVDQLGAHIALIGILKGIYVHPTQAGHDAEAPLLIAAMENPQVDPLAIAYHKLAAPAETMIKALNESECIDDFLAWKDSIDQIWAKEKAEASEPVETPVEPEAAEPVETPVEPETAEPVETPVEPEAAEPEEAPAAPETKTTVITKVATVVKNVVKSVAVTVSAVFTKLGKLFK